MSNTCVLRKRRHILIFLAAGLLSLTAGSDAACQDTFGDCASVINATDICTDHANALLLGCQQSCGFCPTTTTPAPPCVDTYLNCFTVAKLTHLCDNRTSAAKLGCLHTCNFCGIHCQNNPGACNHGKCQPSANGHSCVCDPGYTGQDCFTEIDECASNPCRNGGRCVDKVNSFSCTCVAGFTGIFCEFDIDECTNKPCLFGTCADKVNGFECTCYPGFAGMLCDQAMTTVHAAIRDCKDVHSRHDGKFFSSKGAVLLCDMTTAGGGWTVIMNRENSHVNFTDKYSTDYAIGFGDFRIHGDFWLGLENIHSLTSDGRRYQLRVDIVDSHGRHFYETYDDFSVGPSNRFVLHVGAHRGTAGDSLSQHSGMTFTTLDRDSDLNRATNCARYLGGGWWFNNCYDSCLTCDSLSGHNGMAFSTLDRDRDMNKGANCAVYLGGGGWWYHDCYDACLTCPYHVPGTNECRSMSWNSLQYCVALATARMMLRPM